MNWPELMQLIRMGESDDRRFVSRVKDEDDLGPILTALASGNGGFVVVGLDINQLHFLGADINQEWIEDLVNTHCVPKFPIRIEKIDRDKKVAFCIYVEEGQLKPYFYKKKCYLIEDGALKMAMHKFEPKEEPEQVMVTEPLLEHIEPTIQNIEPALQNIEQSTENFEPAIESEQESLEYVEPVIQNAEPTVQNVEPVIQNIEPTIQNIEPSLQNQESLPQNEGSIVEGLNHEPEGLNHEPKVLNHEPLTSSSIVEEETRTEALGAGMKPVIPGSEDLLSEPEPIGLVTSETLKEPSDDLVDIGNLENELNDRQFKALKIAAEKGSIRNKVYRKQFSVSHKTAHLELVDMVKKKLLVSTGSGRSTCYVLHQSNEARILDKMGVVLQQA